MVATYVNYKSYQSHWMKRNYKTSEVPPTGTMSKTSEVSGTRDPVSCEVGYCVSNLQTLLWRLYQRREGDEEVVNANILGIIQRFKADGTTAKRRFVGNIVYTLSI